MVSVGCVGDSPGILGAMRPKHLSRQTESKRIKSEYSLPEIYFKFLGLTKEKNQKRKEKRKNASLSTDIPVTLRCLNVLANFSCQPDTTHSHLGRGNLRRKNGLTCVCVCEVFSLIGNKCRRAQITVGSGIPRQVGPGLWERELSKPEGASQWAPLLHGFRFKLIPWVLTLASPDNKL